MISLNKPNINFNLKKNTIIDTLKNNELSTAGKYVGIFEKELSKFTKIKYASALNSGTSALFIALRVIGVNKNHEVLVPTLTFIATANSVLYNNASPVFLDVDASHNLDKKKFFNFIRNETFVRNKLTFNKKTKKQIKAIIITHMWGNSFFDLELYNLCKKRNIKIIEDAAEALGSKYIINNKKIEHVGNRSDLVCFSFNGNKIITTGLGGAILSNNKKYIDKVNFLATQSKIDKIRFKHSEVGYNLKLSSLNAALGLEQLKSMPRFLKNKQRIHIEYFKQLNHLEGFSILHDDSKNSNYWLNIISLKNRKKFKAENLQKYLYKKKIETRFVWYNCHKQNYLNKFQSYKIRHSNIIVKNSLCLPSSTDLKADDQEKIINEIKKFRNLYL
jgi:perosamine synthetase